MGLFDSILGAVAGKTDSSGEHHYIHTVTHVTSCCIAATVPQTKAIAAIGSVVRFIAPVHITLSLQL